MPRTLSEDLASIESVTEAVSRFRDEREALRTRIQLQRARAALAAEEALAIIAACDDALRVMGGDFDRESVEAAQLRAAEDLEFDLSQASVPEAILAAVTHFSTRGGATAAELHDWMKARGKTVNRKYVHTYLHRMFTDERVAHGGVRDGLRLYVPGRRLVGMKEDDDMPSG